jgi:hypothetical protein
VVPGEYDIGGGAPAGRARRSLGRLGGIPAKRVLAKERLSL